MLHDPRWNHGTISGLITWLEGKPRDGEYDFMDCYQCLITQYMAGTPRDCWLQEMRDIYHGQDRHRIAIGFVDQLGNRVQTYGAALKRAYRARQAVARRGRVIAASVA